MLCGRSPLCGPPQTVSSPSCVPFSLRELMVNTLLCERTCHIYRISNTSQFSYQRLTPGRIVLVTTDPIIAVPLRCLSDGIFPARKPDLHHYAHYIEIFLAGLQGQTWFTLMFLTMFSLIFLCYIERALPV